MVDPITAFGAATAAFLPNEVHEDQQQLGRQRKPANEGLARRMEKEAQRR